MNFRVGGLNPKGRYWYKVTAYNAAGAMDSNIVFVAMPDEPPAAPTGLRAANFWAQTFDLNWYDTSFSETGFAIQMSTNGVKFTEVGRTGANALSLSVGGLRANARYFFRVVAFKVSGTANSNTLDTRTRA